MKKGLTEIIIVTAHKQFTAFVHTGVSQPYPGVKLSFVWNFLSDFSSKIFSVLHISCVKVNFSVSSRSESVLDHEYRERERE